MKTLMIKDLSHTKNWTAKPWKPCAVVFIELLCKSSQMILRTSRRRRTAGFSVTMDSYLQRPVP